MSFTVYQGMRLFKVVFLLISMILITGCTQYACPSYESYAYGTNRPNYAALRKKQLKAKRHKAHRPVKRAEQ